MGLIYKRTSPSGGIYIGQTSHKKESERWTEHCYIARTTTDRSRLNEAIRKYGENSFTVEILEDNISDSELDNREIFWIAYYDSYFFDNPKHYNMTRGGNQGRGYKHTESWKKAHSEKMMGDNNPSKQHKYVWINDGCENHTVYIENLQLYLNIGYIKGRIESPKVKEAWKKSKGVSKPIGIWMSNGTEEVRIKDKDQIDFYLSLGYQLNKRCYKPTEESKQKLRIKVSGKNNSQYGKKQSKELIEKQINARKQKGQIKPILQINKNTAETICEFDSISDATRELCRLHENLRFNTVVGGIHACCNGRQKSAYGYIWKYKE